MGRMINSTSLSLDGVVRNLHEHTSGASSDEGATYTKELLDSADALLMGRSTYDLFSQFWPTADDEHAERMNALPHYVVSDSLTEPTWTNTHIVPRAHVRDRVRRLKSEGATILQYGFGAVTSNLLEAGLVDELHLWVHPVLVGTADPGDLITSTQPSARLELTDLVRCASGVVILVYRPIRGE